MQTIRRFTFLLVLVASTAVPLVLAGTAGANTADRQVFPPFSYSEDTGITCGTGATGFDIVDSATVYRTDTNFTDNSGNFLMTIRQETKVGTFSNSVTGASVSYTAHGETTFTSNPDSAVSHGGMVVTVPGTGAVLVQAGFFSDTFGPDDEIFVEHGPHDIFNYFFFGDTARIQKLCAALGAT